MSYISLSHGICSFQEPSSIEKIAEVDTHIGVAMSGLTADARTLIEHARVETQVGKSFQTGWHAVLPRPLSPHLEGMPPISVRRLDMSLCRPGLI